MQDSCIQNPIYRTLWDSKNPLTVLSGLHIYSSLRFNFLPKQPTTVPHGTLSKSRTVLSGIKKSYLANKAKNLIQRIELTLILKALYRTFRDSHFTSWVKDNVPSGLKLPYPKGYFYRAFWDRRPYPVGYKALLTYQFFILFCSTTHITIYKLKKVTETFYGI